MAFIYSTHGTNDIALNASVTDGYVGIGTSSPVETLDVNGAARIAGDLKVDSWNIKGTGTETACWTHIGNNAVVLTNDNDSVGIGTSVPSAKLHIQSGSGTVGLRLSLPPGQISPYYNSPMLVFDSTHCAGVSNVFWMRQQQSAWAFNVSDSDLYTNLKTVFGVDSSGNVGIGSVAPTVKLDVAGEVRANIFTGPDGAGFKGWSSERLQYFSTAHPGMSLQVGGAYEGHYGNGHCAAGLTLVSLDDFSYPMVFANYAPSSSIYFSTSGRDAIYYPSLAIDPSGNVGIGKSDPASTVKLDVNGDVAAAKVCIGGASGPQILTGTIDLSTHPQNFLGAPSGSLYLYVASNGDSALYIRCSTSSGNWWKIAGA